MKATKLKLAVGLAASASILAGTAFAQDTSNVVGYEENELAAGFNTIGQRLVGSADITTTVVGIAGTTITLAADSGLAGVRSIFEVTDGTANGTVTVADVNGTGATTDDDLSTELALGDSVTVRELATLASVFGPNNESGILAAASSAAADVVYVPDGLGGFSLYYYRDPFPFPGAAEWRDVATNTVIDPTTVELVYTDGLIVEAKSGGTLPRTLTIVGDVKTDDTAFALGDGAAQFNYISSVYPAGATLESSFGAANEAGLTKAAGSAAADIVLVPDGVAGFDQYYYRDPSPFPGTAEWREVFSNTAIDPTTIDLPSGLVIQNKGAAQNILTTPPSFYANL